MKVVTSNIPITNGAAYKGFKSACRSSSAAPLTFTVLALIIWFFIRDDYGITWDEPNHIAIGEKVFTYFTSSQNFADYSASLGVIANAKYYSPALDFINAAIADFLGMDSFVVKHGINGLMWVSMFWPVCRLGAYLRGPTASWFAGLAMLGMPSLYGHAFNNPVDFSLACATAWLLLSVVWISKSKTLRVRHSLILGIAMAGVLMARPGAWFLVALWGLIPLTHLWRSWCYRLYLFKAIAIRSALVLCGAAVIAYAGMIFLWPHAQQDPLHFPLTAAGYARKFDEVYPVLYRGMTFPSNNLPTDYLAGYLFFTLPIPIVAFFLIGQAIALSRLKNRVFSWAPILGAAFIVWFPLVYFYIAKPNVYDGMRHFLFMLPAVAVTAGAGASWLHSKLKHKLSPAITSILIVALLSSAIPSAVRIHPYQMVYYNLAAGPNQTLHSRFETDYWVSSFREAAEWINQQPSTPDRPLTVLVSANGFSYNAFTHFLKPGIRSGAAMGNFQSNKLDPEIRYYVGMVRYGQYLNFPNLPEAHRIERDGVLLCVIRLNDPGDEIPK